MNAPTKNRTTENLTAHSTQPSMNGIKDIDENDEDDILQNFHGTVYQVCPYEPIWLSSGSEVFQEVIFQTSNPENGRQ